MFIQNFSQIYILFVLFYGLWLGAVSTTFYNRISKNIPMGPSQKPKCNNCNTRIYFPYFFPVIGYFLSKGRCVNPVCKLKIPVDYLILELGIAINVLILLMKYRFYTEEFLFGSILTSYIFFLFLSTIRDKSTDSNVIWFGVLSCVCFTFSKFFPNYQDLIIRILVRSTALFYIDKKNKIINTQQKALIVAFGIFSEWKFDIFFLMSIILMKLSFKILKRKNWIDNRLMAKTMFLYFLIFHYFLIFEN